MSGVDLASWLLEQIAEDERSARDHPQAWYSPRRLAECAAKRRILEEHPDHGGGCGTCLAYGYGGPEVIPGPCPTVRAIALPYADRPGYREEWQP